MAEKAPNSYNDPYWADLSSRAEQQLGLPAGLLNNVVTKGERSNADQVSEAGAATVYQITPSTRKLVLDKYGVDAYLSPENSAEAAGLLLKESLDRNKGDVSAAVAEYHGGTDRSNWGPRTRAYVGRVMAAQRKEPAPAQSTFQRAQAAQAPAAPSNAIAQVYEAYKAGQMTPEEAAEFEADVNSGLVMLPRGATLAGQPSSAPTDRPAPVVLPPEITDAYQTGKLSPQERADLEADIQSGVVQLSTPADQLPEFDDRGVISSQAPGIIPQQVEPTLGEQLVGAGETGLALTTGSTGGAVGMIGGALKGLAEQILSGQFGTQEAADLVEQEAMRGAEALTYAPRTQAGEQQTAAVGEALAPLVAATPFTAELGAITQGARAAAPVARAAAQPVVEAVQTAAAPVRQAVARAGETIRGAVPGERAQGATVGAAATPEALQRAETAAQLPVPFKDKSGLTSGQASRDFAQLQFEKETAKAAELGAPLRERVENQTATLIQNFDALVDRLEPVSTSKRDLGAGVDQALVNRVEVKRREIKKAYDEAQEAGELQEPVELARLPAALAEVEDLASTSQETTALLNGIRNRALKRGDVLEDENGNLVAATIPLEQSESLRKFINSAADWQDPRSALVAKKIIAAIDEATEEKGGDLYRKARRLRADFANEFENVGLTAKLLGSKRGTGERQIALEDVFDKVIVSSKVDEMNKLRSSLLKSGKEGKQAWSDLKAAGIERIKESSMSASQRDSMGNPVLSPDKLIRAIRSFDESGKLESLYGKKQAQIIRDLGEIASVIYTAPPGAINTSNTASALMVALDSLGTFAVTGVPAPVATAIKEASKYVKNKKVKARINEALKGVDRENN
jgi:hypothetical protein